MPYKRILLSLRHTYFRLSKFMKQCISCDWLTINVLLTINENKFNPKKMPVPFAINEFETGTRIFKKRAKITINEYGKIREFGTMVWQPSSEILKQNLCQIKINNSYLYEENITATYNYITYFLDKIGATFFSVSRIDICCDNTSFVDFQNPQDFISNIMENKIFKLRKCKISTFGKHNRNSNKINTIKFGSPESVLSWKIYNKIEELKDKGDKPYIKKKWRKYGWNEIDDVWRCEVEITNTSNIAIYFKDSNILTNLKSCFDEQCIAETFLFLTKKNFVFKYKGTDTNVSRLNTVQLFNTEYEVINEIELYRKENNIFPTRQIKILANELFKESEEQNWRQENRKIKMLQILDYVVNKYNLKEYMQKKCPNYEQVSIL